MSDEDIINDVVKVTPHVSNYFLGLSALMAPTGQANSQTANFLLRIVIALLSVAWLRIFPIITRDGPPM